MIARLLTTIISLILLLSCATPQGEGGTTNSAGGEVSIAYLKSLCQGDHLRIVDDYKIRGIVAATDWYGELNKSMVIVDRSGGLEVAIDSYRINEQLPIYSEVEISCNGLMLARIGGKIELGAAPTGEFPLDNINDEIFDRYIRVIGYCEDFAPAIKSFSELSIKDISAIIRFDKLRICDEEQGLRWCDKVDGEVITTCRTFIDSEGNRLEVRTLPTCDYATEKIPTKEISIVGVVDYSDNRYFVRIVNRWII